MTYRAYGELVTDPAAHLQARDLRTRTRFMEHYGELHGVDDVAVRRDKKTGHQYLAVGTTRSVDGLPTLFHGLPVRQHRIRPARKSSFSGDPSLEDLGFPSWVVRHEVTHTRRSDRR